MEGKRNQKQEKRSFYKAQQQKCCVVQGEEQKKLSKGRLALNSCIFNGFHVMQVHFLPPVWTRWEIAPFAETLDLTEG